MTFCHKSVTVLVYINEEKGTIERLRRLLLAPRTPAATVLLALLGVLVATSQQSPGSTTRHSGSENRRFGSSMEASFSRARIFVSGKVQGVYYRDTTKLKGSSLGLTGVAWNLSDGRVEIVAEGPKAKIEELEAWCWKGPEGAAEVGINHRAAQKRKVTRVELTWEELPGSTPEYTSFANGGKKK